ncbi:MAG: Gfo/Idh/MocA family oxidoreductase [bacterium]
MNVGILGLAHGHTQMYCTQWREHPEWGVCVTAVWDHDVERASKGGAEGVKVCTSPAELLAMVDAVVITAETSMHDELVQLAAAAGKPVVLQKPLSLTIEQADRMVSTIERSGIPFTLAWQMRTDPENIMIKDMFAGGTLGKIFMVRRRHGLSTHLWAGFDNSWHVKPQYNLDIWADDAAHPADFIYWLLGMPESVTAEIGSFLNPKIPSDNGVAIFRYPGGPIAEINCSFTCIAGDNTTEITGEKGSLIQNHGDGPGTSVPRLPGSTSLKWFIQGSAGWTVYDGRTLANQGERISGLAKPLADFLNGRRPPIGTVREGRDVLRMILASRESSRLGVRIRL